MEKVIIATEDLITVHCCRLPEFREWQGRVVMYSSELCIVVAHKSCANLYQGRCVLYIVSAPESAASARQASDNGGSSRLPTEKETGPCPSWPSQSRRVTTQ